MPRPGSPDPSRRSTAHPKRNHRSRSIAYERCVAAGRPIACSSFKNAATGGDRDTRRVHDPNRLPQVIRRRTATHPRQDQRRQIPLRTKPIDHAPERIEHTTPPPGNATTELWR